MDIVALGELLMDMFPSQLGVPHSRVPAFIPVPGGGVANLSVAARRLGATAAFIGKVGDDPFGHHLREVLSAEGVETRGMRLDPHARTTMNLMAQPDPHHYDCFFYRNPGADTLLNAGELDAALLAEARAFHFGSLSLTDEPARTATLVAARQARVAGALISYDVNYRPTLWPSADAACEQAKSFIPLADLVKVNEVELALLTGANLPNPDRPDFFVPAAAQAALSLLDLGPRLVVITLGSLGAIICCTGGHRYVPGFDVETVDSTGCGDAFLAGLLVRLVSAEDWQAEIDLDRLSGHVRYANAVGALTATRQGVFPALPFAADVTAFLDAHA